MSRRLPPSHGVHPAKAASATGIVTIGSDRASVGFEGDNWPEERVVSDELRPFPDVDRISQTGGEPTFAEATVNGEVAPIVFSNGSRTTAR